MRVTCKNILSLPYANQLKVVAGKNYLDNRISWVYNMEDVTYVDWLKGGELVIMTGLLLGHSEKKMIEYVDILYEKNVAGIIINLSNSIKEIPKSVIERGDFLGIPIFEMPAMMRIIDLSQSICRKIILAETSRNQANETLFQMLYGSRLTAKRITTLEKAGYQQGKQYRVVVIQLVENQKKAIQDSLEIYEDETQIHRFNRLEDIIAEYLKVSECLTVIDEDELIWLAPVAEGQKVRQFADDFCNFLEQKEDISGYLIGISNLFSDLHLFSNFAESARMAIEMGKGQREQKAYIYDNLIELRLFDQFKDKDELMDIATLALGDLMLPENKELLYTLVKYVEYGFQAKEASKQLYIHENTMHYRLKKISGLIMTDFQNSHDLFQIMLAIEILKALHYDIDL